MFRTVQNWAPEHQRIRSDVFGVELLGPARRHDKRPTPGASLPPARYLVPWRKIQRLAKRGHTLHPGHSLSTSFRVRLTCLMIVLDFSSSVQEFLHGCRRGVCTCVRRVPAGARRRRPRRRGAADAGRTAAGSGARSACAGVRLAMQQRPRERLSGWRWGRSDYSPGKNVC